MLGLLVARLCKILGRPRVLGVGLVRGKLTRSIRVVRLRLLVNVWRGFRVARWGMSRSCGIRR